MVEHMKALVEEFDRVERLDEENERTVDGHDGSHILEVIAHSHRVDRGDRYVHVVLAGDKGVEHGSPDGGHYRACQSVHPRCVVKDVDDQPGNEGDGQHPSGVQVDWQPQYQIDKHDRHGHVEQDDLVANQLKHHQCQKQQYELYDSLGHGCSTGVSGSTGWGGSAC